MRILTPLSAAVLLCVVAGSASAQTAPLAACMDTATTQSGMTHCAGENYKAALVRMDSALVRARSRLDQDRAALLDASQVAWKAWAESQCEFEGSAVAGGTMYPMTVVNCLAGLTQERIRSIEAATTAK